MANAPALSGFQVYNCLTPEEGPKVIAYSADFTAANNPLNTPIAFDLVKEQDNKQFSFAQAVWIDNTANQHPIQIDVIGGAPFRVKCAGGAMGMFPMSHTGHLRATISNPNGAAMVAAVPLLFYNVPQAYFVTTPGN